MPCLQNTREGVKYTVDTEALTITAISVRTVDDILELRRIVKRMKGYSLEFGGEPSAVAFNAFSPPDASESGSQVKKKRMGFKSQNGEG